MPAKLVTPVTLVGNTVRLEPIEERHAADLARAATPEIFRFFASDVPPGDDEDTMLRYVRFVQSRNTTVAFAAVLLGTGQAVGSTCYLDIRTEHLGLEIGATWYGVDYQKTKVNPECKFLLMLHAFEECGYERVQLKTDGRNLQSQRAIEKLGARHEGVLRKHLVMRDGFIRDTVMYSVLREEWPEVKATLLARLNAEV